MNKLHLISLVCFAYIQIFCTSITSASDGSRAPQKTEFQSPTVVVPASTKAQLLVIEATINDKGPFRFVFDTGTTGMLINADAAKELGLKTIGKSHVGDPSNPSAIEVDRVRARSISIGGVEFSGVDMVSWTPPKNIAAALSGTSGIIGLDLFSDCLMTIDSRGKKIILEDGQLPKINGVDIIRLEDRGEKLPTLRLSVGGVGLEAHLDSGKPGGIALPTNMQKRFKLKGKPVVVGRGRTANSTFETLAATLDGDVGIGGHVIEGPRLSFNSMLNDRGVANIGSGVMRDFVITLDQKNGRIRFDDQRR